MTPVAPAPAHHRSARLALVVAVVTALLNVTIVLAYGWYLPGLFVAAAGGEDFSPGFDVRATVLLLVIGEGWYLTPLLWLAVMLLGVRAHPSGMATAAMVVASVSLGLFAMSWLMMAGWMF